MRPLAYAILLALALGYISSDTSGGQPSAQNKEAGSIIAIQCTAFLKKDEKAAETQLDRKRDKGRKLYVGERLKCSSAGAITINLYGQTYDIDKSLQWYPIPDNNPSNNNSTGTAGRRASADPKIPPAVAAGLAGVWRLDKSKSQGLDARTQTADVTWIITHDDASLWVKPKVESQYAAGAGMTGDWDGRRSNIAGAQNFRLTGEEMTSEISAEMGGTKTTKATWSAETTSLELSTVRTAEFNGSDFRTTTVDILSLSRDGKTLTVKHQSKSLRGSHESTMVFMKRLD